MRKIFISDVHMLGNRDPRTQILAKLISENDAEFFFVGDVFDLWVGNSPRFLEEYADVVKALEGKKFFLIDGNHDFSFSIGDVVSSRVLESNFLGGQAFICHGDEFTGEKLFRFIRQALRSKFIRMAIERNGYFIEAGKLLSKALRKNNLRSSPYGRRKWIFGNMLKAAMRKFAEGYDVVIMGHCHIPCIMKFNISGKEKIFANPGFWGFDKGTYLEFDGELKLREIKLTGI